MEQVAEVRRIVEWAREQERPMAIEPGLCDRLRLRDRWRHSAAKGDRDGRSTGRSGRRCCRARRYRRLRQSRSGAGWSRPCARKSAASSPRCICTTPWARARECAGGTLKRASVLFDSGARVVRRLSVRAGASGNIVTEDLVFMLESMGCRYRHRPGPADCRARAAARRPARRADARPGAEGRHSEDVPSRGRASCV